MLLPDRYDEHTIQSRKKQTVSTLLSNRIPHDPPLGARFHDHRWTQRALTIIAGLHPHLIPAM